MPHPIVSRRSANRPPQAGMTLMEILVVLAIVGLVIGAAAYGLGAITRADLRRASGELAGAIRYLWAEAASTGKAHRLVIDLGAGHISAEVADGRFLLKDRDKTDPGDEDADDPVAGEGTAEGDEGAEGAAPAVSDLSALEDMGGAGGLEMLGGLFGGLESSGVVEGGRTPRMPKPTFATFEGLSVLKPRALPKGVTVSFVFAEHMAEPARDGKAAIYFWPGGLTERAVIELRSGDAVYSVYVPPVTGKARIIAGEMPLPSDMRRFEAADEEVVE